MMPIEPRRGSRPLLLSSVLLVTACAGCYAPLKSPEGISASALPDWYRTPYRTVGLPRNYAELTAPQPAVYRLGLGDKLDVTIPGLLGDTPDGLRPIRVEVMENGAIQLPLVGAVYVGGLGLAEAQQAVNDAYADGYLEDQRVTLHLFEKGTVNVVVLGAVNKPGTYALPRYENDVGRALATAEGLSEIAADVVEVHRPPSNCGLEARQMNPGGPVPMIGSDRENESGPIRQAAAEFAEPVDEPRYVFPAPAPNFTGRAPLPATNSPYMSGRYALPAAPMQDAPPAPYAPGPHVPLTEAYGGPQPPMYAEPYGPPTDPNAIVRIPLRGPHVQSVPPGECLLASGDVVFVPERTQEVFYVVGPLSRDSRTRFTIGDKERQIGSGFLLPPDREIDVVTAVAMAGYIDPIESPTTVTLHRAQPVGPPLLVKVDLIEARTNARENLLVAPGDIIYLNPDPPWWFRRVLDQVIPTGLGIALGRAVSN